MSYTEILVVNYCVIYLTGFVGIMMCYAKPVAVNHCVMLIRCVGIMVCYSEPVVGNHGVDAVPVGVNQGQLCLASSCESLCVILCQ
jgi:hypothetical protein